MTGLSAPACPTCRAELTRQTERTFDAWVCPEHHGLAFTLSEAYERLSDDEVHAIWRGANADDATRSTHGCPMCAATMVAVPCEGITLDVCAIDEVLWFDAGELEQLPPDTGDVAPSPGEQADIAAITDQFGDALDEGWDAEERGTITGRLTAHLLGAHTA